MKISNCLFGLAILVAGAGCRSANDRMVSSSTTTRETIQTPAPQEAEPLSAPQADSQGSNVLHGSIGDFDYTVEVIPNPRLSATSREGDRPTEVYSSNIVAVHVYPRGAGAVNSTDSGAPPNQESNMEPAGK